MALWLCAAPGFDAPCFGIGSNSTPRNGVKTTATTQLASSASPTTQKMPPAYSPVVEFANPTGMNPAAVTSVPDSIGNAVEVQAWLAARTRSQPSSSFTTMVSIAMIASSTSSPSDRISAPSEIRCNSIPQACITTNTSASVNGTASATTSPARKPSEANDTSSTTASAMTNFIRNSPTASCTTCGWSAVCSSVSPSGRSALIRATSACNASPKCSALAPLRIDTAITTAPWPL